MKQIKINEKDNVAVMLEGELSGHKIALNDIKKGENSQILFNCNLQYCKKA